MEEIDRLLKQWIPVNTIIREEIRNAIVKHKMESMDRAFAAGRNAERIPERIFESKGPIDYGNEQMVNPAINSVPDDGVCEGEYVHPTHPTQEEIIAFNREENNRKINKFL